MRYYQVNVNFLPELQPHAQDALEQMGMSIREERHGLLRGWMGARNEQHALGIAQQALAVIEDGDVTIIKPSPEPGSRATEARRPFRRR